MSIGDKVVAIGMGISVVCAILTLVSYLLYTLFNIGEAYFSTVFFMCAMISAAGLIAVGVIIMQIPCKSRR